MTKRSKTRQTQQNKDHSGCMWRFISIFDFRHGQTTRRLLSDKRIVIKDTIVSEFPTSEANTLASSEEKDVKIEEVEESENPTLDVVKTSVKKLMEEEMVSEQASTIQSGDDNDDDDDDVEFFDSGCGIQVKDDNHTEKISKKSFDNHEITAYQKSSHYSDLEALMKEILLIYQSRNDRQGDLDGGRNRAFSVVEEKLSAAVEVLMNEKSSEGNVEKAERSKDFIDMFQMLSTNKELFLKLLQDQINANEDRKSMSMPRSNSVENEPCVPKQDVPVTRKHRNFFRRRSKSQESISLTGEHDDPLNTSRIVILKPNSPDNRFKVENDVHRERFSSHFSFMEIKKRLKSAIGKEQSKHAISEKTVVEGSNGWSSPNRDHFYIERFAKKIGKASKLHESETKQRENNENGDTSRHISSIYVEAKKHLCELLNSGDEDTEFMMERLPKTLGNMLSFPQYSSLSPHTSPRKENNLDIVTAELRSPPDGNILADNESRARLATAGFQEKPKVSDEVNPNTFMGEILSSRTEDMHLAETVETEKPENREEMEVLDVNCEQCGSPESIDDDEDDEIVKTTDEERSPECLKSDLTQEKEFSSPMGSSLEDKIEEPESTSSDRTERPSPVSVLEPLFSDKEISPASTCFRPVKDAIQPLRIRFEDQDIYARTRMENEESAFEYVEAVLLASDLNWDEFEKRWLSSTQILDSSLFNDVEIFSSRPFHDQRLLFDSANEILKEVCDCYLDLFLELSFIRKKIQPVPKGANLINEVWERIELHLKDNYPLSLDHLVKKDLEISRTWMDIRSDSRELLSEIDESIFEDMMDDTLLSFFCEFIDDETLHE